VALEGRADALGGSDRLTICEQPTRVHAPPRDTSSVRFQSTYFGASVLPMSKRTVKRKLRTKKKANHGKKPNCGRG
jgi:hypothetical protein